MISLFYFSSFGNIFFNLSSTTCHSPHEPRKCEFFFRIFDKQWNAAWPAPVGANLAEFIYLFIEQFSRISSRAWTMINNLFFKKFSEAEHWDLGLNWVRSWRIFCEKTQSHLVCSNWHKFSSRFSFFHCIESRTTTLDSWWWQFLCAYGALGCLHTFSIVSWRLDVTSSLKITNGTSFDSQSSGRFRWKNFKRFVNFDRLISCSFPLNRLFGCSLYHCP